MEKVIGEIEVPLDGRFSRIRTQETNLGGATVFIYAGVDVKCEQKFLVATKTTVFVCVRRKRN